MAEPRLRHAEPRTDLRYQVVPHMPTARRSGSGNAGRHAHGADATLTFTGDDVFAYGRGIGRTTLIGTAGTTC